MSEQRIRRTAKGKRPLYFSDPATDKLMAIVLSLVAELSVSRERIDALERVLEEKGLLSRDDVDGYAPDSGAESERAESRAAYIQRVMRIVTMELQPMDDSGATPAFSEALKVLLEPENGS
jgi:hypothetical protein